jgi:hypothetical protein
MKQSSQMNQRIPRVAVIGLFQGGKSLLVNAALSGCYVPVGKQGLRTTPCRIRCRHGDLSRAVAHHVDGSMKGLSIRALSRHVESAALENVILSIDLFLCNPLLQEIEIIDTPGIDYSEEDNKAALEAARESDAVVLIIQQSLPEASNSFKCIVECLQGKTWGMVLNCGRAGPHLEYADSPASIEVAESAIHQLVQAGLPEPRFSQRMNARTLSYYASENFASDRAIRITEEHLEDLAADESSIRQWRNNLATIGKSVTETQLANVRFRIMQFLNEQRWSNPSFTFDIDMKSFACKVSFDGTEYEVTGRFHLESINLDDRLVIYDFDSKDQWIVDWLLAEKNLHYWEIK